MTVHLSPSHRQSRILIPASGRCLPVPAVNSFMLSPIPAPVEHLRPARDTCEACHWPEKFHGKRTKQFISFPNDNQKDPAIQGISLHIGGRSPYTETFEGIHWHVSKDVKVEYLSLNETRTAIGKIKVSKPNGITEEYNMPGETEEKKAGKEPGGPWTASTAIIDRPMSTRISPRKSIRGCTPNDQPRSGRYSARPSLRIVPSAMMNPEN